MTYSEAIAAARPVSVRGSRTASQVLVGVAIVMATLWDFRVANIRIFDAVAVAILVPVAALALWRGPRVRLMFGTLFFIVWMAAYAAYGFAALHHRSSLAIIFGVLLLLVLTQLRPHLFAATVWYSLAAWIHVAAFVIQVAVSRITGTILDYHDGLSRIYTEAPSQRWCGLFEEPNSYSLTIFMLLIVAMIFRPSRLLLIVGAATMVISQSLWGVGMGGGVIVIHGLTRMSLERQRFRDAARTIIVNGLVVLAISSAFLWADKPARLEYPPLIGRILTLAGDSSLRDRYIDQSHTDKLRGWLIDIKPKFGFSLPPWVKPMFGYGLSTAYFLGGLPDNGYALIWKSFGAAGSGLLFAVLAMMLRPLPKGQRRVIAVSIAFIMTTYPLFTYLVLWLWLATLIISFQINAGAGSHGVLGSAQAHG